MSGRRLLVIGASGLVGTAVARQAREPRWRLEVVGVARSVRSEASLAVDWTDEQRVLDLLADTRPSHIAVCAAWPHVDGCEADPKRSERENVRPLQFLCEAASCPVLFFSTDHVFDGSRFKNVESDPVHPLNVYARHKRVGEELVLAHPDSLVVRTSWVFGAESAHKNFVYRVVDAAQSCRPLRVPRGQAGCPTHANWLAQTSLELWFSGMTGVVHLSGAEDFTKAEWARTVASGLGLPEVSIEEVSAQEAGQLAPRPTRVVLKSERHTLTQPTVQSILRRFRSEILSA